LLVAVSGNIGAGKSTLAKSLCERGGLHLVPEPVEDNPYLGDFYADPVRWAYHAQTFIMSVRHEQQKRAHELSRSGTSCLLDRCLHEDRIFAAVARDRGYLSPREWNTYATLHRALLASAPPPEVVVYLRTTPEVAFARTMQRARTEEATIPLDYLAALHAEYERWAEDMELTTRVLAVDVTESFADPDAVWAAVQALRV
jgi:deoxyadenosine/deoxycytidine kinase